MVVLGSCRDLQVDCRDDRSIEVFRDRGFFEPQFKCFGYHCDCLVLSVAEARDIDLEALGDVSVAFSVDHDGQAQVPQAHAQEDTPTGSTGWRQGDDLRTDAVSGGGCGANP